MCFSLINSKLSEQLQKAALSVRSIFTIRCSFLNAHINLHFSRTISLDVAEC